MSGLFLVISHSRRPAPGQDPSVKDFGKVGDHLLVETSEVVTVLRHKTLNIASAVLDILNNTVVKNRYGDRSTEIYEAYADKFRNEINEALGRFGLLTARDKKELHVLSRSQDSMVTKV